jgi:exonuclease SbcC
VRPLKLTIDGFACFRDKQELDFEHLDLFAISGPTGAGKSSLLDAMIFALYGKVPRVGKNYTECIALGRDRLVVTLDVRVGAKTYRVTRIGRRRSAGSAQLDEIIDGQDEARPIADQVREVDRHVEALVGLGYEAFTQAVVLPQNQFAEFLQSDPRERQKILSSLLRLDVYERMKKRAGEMASKFRAGVEADQRRIAEDYAGATPEAVDSLATKIGDTANKNLARSREVDKTEKSVTALKRLYDKTIELNEERARLRKLNEAEQTIRATETRLAKGKQAAQLVPKLDATSEAERHVNDVASRRTEQQAVELKAARAVEQCADKLEKTKTAAAEVPALEKRIRALDELKGALKSKELAEKKLDELVAAIRKQENERDARATEVVKAKKELALQAKAVAQLEKALAGVGFDAALAKKVDGWRDRATQLAERRAASTKAAETAAAAEQRASKDNKEAQAALNRQRASEKQHDSTRESFERDEKALRMAESEHSAALLKAELRVGELCPVCEQSITKLPPKAKTPRLEELRARFSAAGDEVERFRKQLADDTRAANRLVSAAEKSAESAQEHRRTADDSLTVVDRLAAKIEAGVGELVGGKKTAPIEERLLSAVSAQAASRERFEQAKTSHDEAIQKQGSLERTSEKLESQLTSSEQNLESLQARAQEQRDEVTRVTTEIRRVTKRDDPLQEREELAGRCKDLEERVGALQEQLQILTRTAREEDAKGKEIARQLNQLQATAKSKRKESDAALAEARFASERSVRDALISPAEQQRLGKQVDDHRQETHAANKQIAALGDALGGDEVTEARYAQATCQLQELRSAHEAGIKSEASLNNELGELKRKVGAAGEILKRLEQERLEYRDYDRLAADLRSDRFQEFILREAFAELVARASERLFKLTGRYTLSIQDSDFDVIDRDNAGERRSAKTLSGGETFLASLALALELSEQVQRAAGAVALDSLFIDEGFGSLDPEALDIATDAIQSLPQGGRMVGIITHIAELTARLDTRVIVEKRAEGSRIRVEGA